MIDRLDRERIAEAMRAAEAESRGEVVCVLAGEVSDYREVPLAWAIGAALILPPLALAAGLEPLDLAGKAGVWMAMQGGALARDLGLLLGLYALAQALLFVAAYLIVHIPAVRRALTPAVLKRHRVERAAQHHFAALASLARGSETGVLLFVAAIDKQVRVLAHAALHDKADESAWSKAADAVARSMRSGGDPTAGICAAIDICGAALKAHFPATAGESPTEHAFVERPIDI